MIGKMCSSWLEMQHNSIKIEIALNSIVDKYFCLKNYFTDFDIEFEKFVVDEQKQEWLKKTVNEI